MANKSPAYRWYPRDILGSLRVASMTAAEECWYRRALDFAWLNHGIPSDPIKLSRIIGKKCTVKGAELVLTMFDVSDNPQIVVSERQEHERLKQKEWSEKSAQGGRKKKAPEPPTDESKTEPPLEANDKQNDSLKFVSAEDSPKKEESREAALPPAHAEPVESVQPPIDEPEPECKPVDPRKVHPSIIGIWHVTGKYPPKELWDELIDTMGEDIDEANLKKCWVQWRVRGFKPTNFAWALEWYRDGIPDLRKNGNGTNRNDQNRRRDTSSDRIAATADIYDKYPSEAEIAAGRQS